MLPAAMLCVLLARQVWDVDIFWQLKLGELILSRQGPINTEPFSALHLGEPLPAVAWLGQAIMAAVRLAGGWGLLRLFDALCWLGGFWIAAAACRYRGAAPAAIVVALVLAFLPALPTASIRPQSFAVLCFGSLLALHRLGLSPMRTIAIGIPLLLTWQNLHPSVSVGVAAMGASAVPGWIAWVFRRGVRPPLAATGLAAIGMAATFATPDGLSVIEVSRRNAEASIAIGASEWLPLWIPGNWLNAVPVGIVIVAWIWLIVRVRARVDAGEIAVSLLLLAMTLTAYRFVLFWAVAMVPVLARAATPQIRISGNDRTHPRALVIPLLLVAMLGPLLLPTRFAPNIPLAALDRLKRENVRGVVFGDFPFGGAIIDRGYPDWRVAYDGRYYRYSSDEWKYNGGIENDFVPLVDIERKWQPVAFVLNVEHNAPTAEELAISKRWRRIYARDEIVVFVRRRFRRPG